MPLKILDNKVRSAFSNSAMQYDVLSGLQKEIGRELIHRVQDREDCRCILDVGMGTGSLTDRLSFVFPEAKVFGIDFADGMIDCARQKYDSFGILQADAKQLPFQENIFDLIVSNLAYQWVDNLQEAFHQSFAALKEGGIFCLTMFGQRTLEELLQSIEDTSFSSIVQNFPSTSSSIKKLPNKNQILAAIRQAGFKNADVDTEIIKVHFRDMFALVKWLKQIGANAGGTNTYIGKNRFFRVSGYYERHFSDRWGVYASFEVVWVKAEK